MKSLLLLLLCLVLLSLACETPAPVTESPDTRLQYEAPFRPHILWLVAEDLGPYIPAFGDSTIETPNLSRLAAEGVRYTHVFSPSGVCSPSRAAIATGMYPSSIGALHMRTGPWFPGVTPEIIARMAQYMPPGIAPYEAQPPAGVRLHSEYLRRAGFYCTNNSKEDYQFIAPVSAWDESSRSAHWRNRQPGQPFFAIFNFNVTHESQIWDRAEDSLWVAPDLAVPVPPYLPDNEIGQRDIRRMYSNIRMMDHQVGEILTQLEEDGLLDSTIIVWYTDHGGPLPRMKRLLYDSGMRLPMIIRFPQKVHAGKIDSQLISFIDFKPTLLSLAQISVPEYVQGQSFLGSERATKARSYVHGAADRFDERYDLIRAVRDRRFKYLRNYRPEQGYYLPVAYREQMPIMQELLRLREAGELTEVQAQWFRDKKPKEELFDCEADPHEVHNLAQNPAYEEILVNLRAECDRWMAAIDDQGLIPESELRAQLWPEGQQPLTLAPQSDQVGEKLALRSATAGASIAYQWVDPGQAPGRTWQVYTDELEPVQGKELIALAHRIGYQTSETMRWRASE